MTLYCFCIDNIGGVMFNVLASSAVDRGFQPLLGQAKDYEIGIFSDNVSEWNDMSTRELLLQWVSSMQNHLSALV